MGLGEIHGDNRFRLLQNIQTATRLRHITIDTLTVGNRPPGGDLGGHQMGRNSIMMRAVIGTVAVLAGFAVLEESVDASTGLAGSCKAAQAYALLPVGEQLAVRAAPTPEAAVVGMIVPREMVQDLSSATVTMISSEGGWARIA